MSGLENYNYWITLRIDNQITTNQIAFDNQSNEFTSNFTGFFAETFRYAHGPSRQLHVQS